MKKCFSILTVLMLMGVAEIHAQYGGARVYVQPGYRTQPRRVVRTDNFQPTLNISLGYGFPNLDKNQFADFTHATRGTASQNGPVVGAVDFQFSRYMSVGVMGTYGKSTANYYDDNNSDQPAFTGKLENWSIMFNLVNYFPSYNKAVSPYLRTAAGVNNWTESYVDGNNKSVADNLPEPQVFSYQVSLGARVNLSPNAGFFMEAGYGKYILAGGLQFRL